MPSPGASHAWGRKRSRSRSRSPTGAAAAAATGTGPRGRFLCRPGALTPAHHARGTQPARIEFSVIFAFGLGFDLAFGFDGGGGARALAAETSGAAPSSFAWAWSRSSGTAPGPPMSPSPFALALTRSPDEAVGGHVPGVPELQLDLREGQERSPEGLLNVGIEFSVPVEEAAGVVVGGGRLPEVCGALPCIAAAGLLDPTEVGIAEVLLDVGVLRVVAGRRVLVDVTLSVSMTLSHFFAWASARAAQMRSLRLSSVGSTFPGSFLASSWNGVMIAWASLTRPPPMSRFTTTRTVSNFWGSSFDAGCCA